MTRLQRRRFSQPAEVRVIPRGRIDVVELDDWVVGRFAFEPGWRWSRDVGPIAGTATCQYHHFASSRTFAQAAELRAERTLGSILFTNIVDSTRHAERLGDHAWAELLARHNEIATRELDRFRGRTIKSTGDGVLALFDGAERAVRCAAAVCLASQSIGLAIRAGIHTGEVEIGGGDVRGVAVHHAARIMSLAGPSEVYVSATTHDLLAGSELVFADAGMHELKGLTGTRQVFKLSAAPA